MILPLVLAYVNAALSAINFALYASSGDPVSLGVAVWAGLVALIIAVGQPASVEIHSPAGVPVNVTNVHHGGRERRAA